MSEISEINKNMPSILNTDTEEYLAIFGNETFTPESDIEESEDYNCGAIANELEYVKNFCEYITRSQTIDDFYTDYLDRILKFFLGLVRANSETDLQLQTRFKALCVRKLNTSWNTKWAIRDVFTYFFDVDDIYVLENYTVDNFLLDGSFNTGLDWTKVETGGSTINLSEYESFDTGSCEEFNVDASGSDCSLYQQMADVPQGNYILSFFRKDDMQIDVPLKVSITRSSDSYYYNFETWLWQATAVFLEVPKISTADRYELVQAYVRVVSTDDITLTFHNIGSTTTAYQFWIDKVIFGTKLEYPNIKVIILTSSDTIQDYMSLWANGADPLSVGDYTIGSYLDQAYILKYSGSGSFTFEHYQEILNIVKASGVKALLEFINKGE